MRNKKENKKEEKKKVGHPVAAVVIGGGLRSPKKKEHQDVAPLLPPAHVILAVKELKEQEQASGSKSVLLELFLEVFDGSSNLYTQGMKLKKLGRNCEYCFADSISTTGSAKQIFGAAGIPPQRV